MELKSLILGLVFSLAIFAVKSGAGLSYLLQGGKARWPRIMMILAYVASYGLLFFLVWLISTRLDFLAHLDTVMLIFKNGMTAHFVLALLLLVWGIALLKRDCPCGGKSRAWLLLVMPCPVCFMVILGCGSFLAALRPDEPWLFVWLATGFIGVGLGTAFIVGRGVKTNAEHGLGLIMVVAALYFLLTIALVPQFSDAQRVYRLSLAAPGNIDNGGLPYLLLLLVSLFMVGFLKNMGKQKWK